MFQNDNLWIVLGCETIILNYSGSCHPAEKEEEEASEIDEKWNLNYRGSAAIIRTSIIRKPL